MILAGNKRRRQTEIAGTARQLSTISIAMAAMLSSAQTLGAPWEELPSPQPPEAPIVYDIDNFVILVKDKIVIPNLFEIHGDPNPLGSTGHPRADIGAQGPDKGNREPLAEGTISLGQAQWVSIPADASSGTIEDSAIVAGEALELGKRSQTVDVVVGDDLATDISSHAWAKGPTVAKILGQNDLPLIPDYATFNPSADSADDILCPIGGTVHLSAGTYRDLRILKNCSLILDEAGEYIFRRITTAQSFDLFVNDAVYTYDLVLLKVEEFVQFQEFGRVNGTNPDVGINKVHTVFKIQVRGQDGHYGGDNNNPDGVPLGGAAPEPAAFVYYGDGQFNACQVVAPYGTVGFGGHQEYATQALGQSFRQVNAIGMTFEPPPAACIKPPAGCACIEGFGILPEDGLIGAGRNIEVRGTNLAVDSFQRLGIFTESAVLDLNNMPDMGDIGADQPAGELVFISSAQFYTEDNAGGESLCEQIHDANGPGIYHLVLIGNATTVSGTNKTNNYCVNNTHNLEVFGDGSCSKI